MMIFSNFEMGGAGEQSWTPGAVALAVLLGRIFCGFASSLVPPVLRACSSAPKSAGLVGPTGRKGIWWILLLVGPCDANGLGISITQRGVAVNCVITSLKKIVLNFKAVYALSL